ncbi:MAG: hypothetical protein U0Z44_04795 [Kouleothrix sp.]
MAQPSEQPPLSQPDVAAILAALRGEVRAQRLAQGQLELTPLERDLQRSLGGSSCTGGGQRTGR